MAASQIGRQHATVEVLSASPKAREPARDVGGEIGVVAAEHFAESGFFVKEDEEVDAEDDHAGSDDCDWIGSAEDEPKADPADEETQVHRIAHVAVKTNDNQFLRRSDGRGCAVACAAEVPDAAESYSKTESGRNGSEQAPARGAGGVNMEAEPGRKKPEPEGEEGGADNERGDGCEQIRGGRRGMRCCCGNGGQGETPVR